MLPPLIPRDGSGLPTPAPHVGLPLAEKCDWGALEGLPNSDEGVDEGGRVGGGRGPYSGWSSKQANGADSGERRKGHG